MNTERSFPVPPPSRIETHRLVLRAWTPADVGPLTEALNESISHLLPWVPWARPDPVSLEEIQERLEGWIAGFRSGDEFLYGIFDRGETELLGGIGLYRRVGPGALEIGYWIRAQRVGRGYATEASRAVTEIGFSLGGVESIQMHCDPANVASKRIPEKLGYRLSEERRSHPSSDGTLQDTDVFELTKGEYPDSGRSGG